jgi:tetratricopeptide (TPR) repeat protein
MASPPPELTARLWDEDGKEIAVLEGHGQKGVSQASFSPDGKMIMTVAEDRTYRAVRLWDTNGNQIANNHWHCRVGILEFSCPLIHATFSPDGKRVLATSDDNTARLWVAATGTEIAVLEGATEGPLDDVARHAAFSPDGKRILLALENGASLLWTIPENTAALVQRAKELVPRCLTEGQRNKVYLPPEPPRWCITGAGRESEKNTAEWKGKWPYHTKEWKDWLAAKDTGKSVILPTEIAKRVATYVSRGKEALKAQNDGRALSAFTEAITWAYKIGGRQKDAAEAYLERAKIYRKKGDASSSTNDFSEAQRLGADVVLHFMVKADGAARYGDYDTAVLAFTEAIDWASKLEAENKKALANAYIRRGYVLIAKQNYTAAIEDFQKAAGLGYEIYAWQRVWAAKRDLARQLIEQGKPIQALLTATMNYLDLTADVRKIIKPDDLKVGLTAVSYPIAEIHAQLSLQGATKLTIVECDKLAGHPSDPFRVTTAISMDQLDAKAAIAACTTAIENDAAEPRYLLNRARAYSKAADEAVKAGGKTQTEAHFKAMHDDLAAAMDQGYPSAFNNLGYAYGQGEGVEKNEGIMAAFYLETFNRTVHCCWVPVARHLLENEADHDPTVVRRVVHALTQWAAALGTEGAQALLDELYAAGTLIKPADVSAIAKDTFTDLPTWLREPKSR